MRERRADDWRVDLAERHPLEFAVARALGQHPALTLLASSTASTDRLDYQVLGPGDRLVQLELKAKRQPYRGWEAHRPDVPEPELFILDELALRKIVDAGRYGFLVVRDLPQKRWCVWSTAELVLAPKGRVSRRLATGARRAGAAVATAARVTPAVRTTSAEPVRATSAEPTKGKVLLDSRDAAGIVPTLSAALDAVVDLIDAVDRRWGDIAAWPAPGHATQGGAA